jgi:hypothetical protein
MVCFSLQKFSTSKINVARCTPKFYKLPYATGSVNRELSGKIMSLYNSGKIVCSLCVRISLSHHMPLNFWKLLYWTMKETNHPRRYSKGVLLKYGPQMLIKEFISPLKKAPCFLHFVLTCLHYQRSGVFLINCVSSCHLFFHLQYQIPNRPTSFQLSVAELHQILLNYFEFGFVSLQKSSNRLKKQSIEMINHVGPNINYTITVSQDKQLHMLLIYISPYLAATCFG